MFDLLQKLTKDQQSDFLNDVREVHYCIQDEDFDTATKLFVEKWQTIDAGLTGYVQDVWFTQHKNWYLGAVPDVPTTNNSLEAFNQVIKANYSFRQKLEVSPLIQCLVKLISDYSNKYAQGNKVVSIERTITGDDYRRTAVFLREKRDKHVQVRAGGDVLIKICSNKSDNVKKVNLVRSKIKFYQFI